MAEASDRTPRWVWVVIVALAALQPLVHGLTWYAAPPDTVPTGLHIPDSALFLHSMDHQFPDFDSAYAGCRETGEDHSIRYYSVPHLWLYGVLGAIVRWLPGEPFLYYGLVNGLGALLYLWAAFHFLRVVAPRHAQPAFLLFTISGGPGGILYLLTGLAGLHGYPRFDDYFYRFGVYELVEGPHFQPVLYFPRLYYTLSLAGCLGGMAALLRADAEGRRLSRYWQLAILAASFLDARFAVFTFGLLVLYVAGRPQSAPRAWGHKFIDFGLPMLAGLIPAAALMSLNPAVVDNHHLEGAMAMWFSPFLIATALHWMAGGRALARGYLEAPRAARALLGAGLGYLAAYAMGYFAYQAYYGNLLRGRDGSVAAAVSDPALLGALAGLIIGLWARPRTRRSETAGSPHVWVLLWLVGYSALALSGFGQGWFLRFGPQRLQVFLWLPLCLVAAQGLATWAPAWRRRAFGTLIVCGLTSIAVATVAFQTPLGRVGAIGPYPNLHTENMHQIDRALMARIGEGTVLAPAPASDVIVRLRGNPVIFGIGSFNLTTEPYAELRELNEHFFDVETPDAERESILRNWPCIQWVYCPHTWPVPEAVRAVLATATWLDQVATDGNGALYRVR